MARRNTTAAALACLHAIDHGGVGESVASKSPGSLKIAGTQRLIEAVFLVAVLIRYLRAAPAEIKEQVLLLRNTAIHGILRQLKSAHYMRATRSITLQTHNVSDGGDS